MLTRKMLSAMGIEPEKVDEIINAHVETVNGLKEEIDKYKADSQRLETVQKELDALQKSGEKSPYKVKYEAAIEERDEIKQEFEKYKTGIAEKETLARKQDAYRNLLREVGISEKRIDAIMRVSNFDSLELAEDGGLKDSDKLSNDIKEEWSDFITSQREVGTPVANPPAGNGKETPLSREEIMKITDTRERQEAWQKFLDERKK